MNAKDQNQHYRSRAMPLICTIVVGFMVWAAVFEIDQSVRATGQIVPSARNQIIQAADGGVLAELLVEEGQAVTRGQKLAVLERDRSAAGVDESRARDAFMSAALSRSRAEALGQSPVYDAEARRHPASIQAQQGLYEQRRLGLQQELSALSETLQSAREELQLNEKLLASGDSSQLEVMRARRQVTEIEARLNAARNKYQQEARMEAAKLSEEQAANRFRIEERSTYLGHTELLSPVTGIIKSLKVTTLGGVLRPGDELLQISPTEGDMVIDIRISPVDIGDLRTGLPVSVKLDAFDYSIYGSLQGVLSHISADTLVEQGPNGATVTYYRGQVKLAADTARGNSKLSAIVLKPGMTASIDILTGRRTVLQYLAKPVFRAFGGAMSER
jgi:adhesin transport system membrane fusion protein